MTIGISSKDMHMGSKKEFMMAESRMVVIEEVSPLCRMNGSWVSSTQHGGCHCNAALDTGAGYKDAHILQCSLGWLCEVKI